MVLVHALPDVTAQGFGVAVIVPDAVGVEFVTSSYVPRPHVAILINPPGCAANALTTTGGNPLLNAVHVLPPTTDLKTPMSVPRYTMVGFAGSGRTALVGISGRLPLTSVHCAPKFVVLKT